MIERDGLEMLVRAYYNQDKLLGVSKATGVPVSRIEDWMRGGKLSKEDRVALCKDISPEFTGKVKVGKPVQLYDGDGLEITKSSKFFNFECCKCGLVHKVTIEWKKKSVILRFEAIEDEEKTCI